MTLTQQKTLVARFLDRCNRYADGKLAAYRRELEEASGPRSLELQDKICHWTAYRTFNEHAIEELETERLDHWFDEPQGREEAPDLEGSPG